MKTKRNFYLKPTVALLKPFLVILVLILIFVIIIHFSTLNLFFQGPQYTEYVNIRHSEYETQNTCYTFFFIRKRIWVEPQSLLTISKMEPQTFLILMTYLGEIYCLHPWFAHFILSNSTAVS